MTFDTQTMLIIGGVLLALAILVGLVLRLARRRQSLQAKAQARVGKDGGDPYAVSKERPYMAPPPAEPEPKVADAYDPPAVPLPGGFAGIALPPHSTDHPDPLTRLKGVGPKLESLLNQEGIITYAQLASLDESELAALDAKLGTFKGRLARDRVLEQARLLASGETAEYEEKFGKLGG